MSSRTLSRLVFVQATYWSCFDSSDQVLEIKQMIDECLTICRSITSDPCVVDEEFIVKLWRALYTHAHEIDSIMKSHLTRDIATMDLLLQSVLKCGICELMYSKTPYKVVISEYVQLVRGFFSLPEVNFTNAILDKIATKVRHGH